VPNATAVRRRRAAVLAAAGAAFVLGASFGAAAGDEVPRAVSAREGVQPRATAQAPDATPTPGATPAPTPAPVDALSLEQQVGRLVVLRFNGTTVPSYVRKVLHNGWASGAILFKENIVSPQQLRTLTAALHKSGKAGGATPIVCTDQEGGVIRNVTWAPPVAAQSAQVPGRDAQAAAVALRTGGINVGLAPVADVPSVDDAAMGGREFSRDPARVVAATKAAVAGWLAGGVKPTVKHFPGLGGTTVNTDRGSATIGGGAPTADDLAPFQAAIAAKVPIVMSSNAVYPRLDARHIAAQSPAILKTLLRDQLGFGGVVMTDSVEAAAVRATGSTEDVAVHSIRAGNDIVLTTGQGSWIRAYRALLAEARSSKSFRAVVRASAARVLALQASLG
jgi:beta-N-acetylhexosaminidase